EVERVLRLAAEHAPHLGLGRELIGGLRHLLFAGALRVARRALAVDHDGHAVGRERAPRARDERLDRRDVPGREAAAGLRRHADRRAAVLVAARPDALLLVRDQHLRRGDAGPRAQRALDLALCSAAEIGLLEE